MSALVCATAYQFRDTEHPTPLASDIRECCERESLLGTVTLSPEGINLGLCGPGASIEKIAQHLQEHTPFDQLRFRHSAVDPSPYHRLHVRVCNSLLPVQVDLPVAQRNPGHHLPPRKLRDWLREGKPVRLLDVRNRFESRLGKFAQAETLGLERFRDFPQQAETLHLDDAPVVTYCTGGIRCEVATAWITRHRHPPGELWQLSGGILNYFEQCGGEFWEGDCFVFDDRLAVDYALRPTHPRLCRHCQRPMPGTEATTCADCHRKSCGVD